MPDGSTRRRSCSTSEQLTEIPIDEKVRFLRKADSYPDKPTRVEIVETHYSWVFLTDHYAYKLKKPVQGEGFDFRTVEARRRNALEEIRLNRRLAVDVYLAVIPLGVTADGSLVLEDGGVPLDWLVKMRRLAAEQMFDRRLAARSWQRGDIEPIARHLAHFYATARSLPVAPPRFTAQIHAEIAAARRAFGAAGVPPLLTAVQAIAFRLNAFLTRRAALFRHRLHERRLVEGHGDLRPEHIYVNGAPRIIDRLEFRPDLRRLDPVGEIAYLALECRRLGGRSIEDRLLRRYRERTGDMPPRELVRFYAALNAVVRSRLAAQHLADPGTRKAEEWLERAANYLAIAGAESRFLSR